MVASHASRYARGVAQDGRYLEIRYTDLRPKTVAQLFALHLYEPKPAQWVGFTKNNVLSKLREINPAVFHVYTHRKSKFSLHTEYAEEPTLSFPVSVLVKKNIVYLIKAVCETNKCEQCGTFYKTTHTCNVRNRDYYFHHINHVSAQWWEPISFFPIGSPPEMERLFITYDVETYTWHGAFGKQLIPFMLVFKVSGDPALVDVAVRLAEEQEWAPWSRDPGTFYKLVLKVFRRAHALAPLSIVFARFVTRIGQ